MSKRRRVWIATVIGVVLLIAVGLRVLSRPPDSDAAAAPAIDQDETVATLAALKPPPATVTRQGVLALEPVMLDRWWDHMRPF